MDDQSAGIRWERARADSTAVGAALRLVFSGRWTLAEAMAHQAGIAAVLARKPDLPGLSAVSFDLSGVEALDTAGALAVSDIEQRLHTLGLGVTIEGLRADLAVLFERVRSLLPIVAGEPPPARGLINWIAQVGLVSITLFQDALALIDFIGAFFIALGRLAYKPQRIRINALVTHLEQAGLNAMPIVGLISFLVGVVIAFQGADQLRRFGAEILTIDMVGISILREMGILLTAIVVAGRSGSAFTAQIGTMQINEEVDALRTIGLDPMEVLVLPRVLALVLALPLLTFFADLMGILGGGVMCTGILNISLGQYFELMQSAVTLDTFMVGMAKAPVFALLIAIVGCFEGMRVRGSAESVGRLTTRAVVEGIFLVIVFDALFSVLFSYLDI